MATQPEALIETVEKLLDEVNEGIDCAERVCRRLDRLQKGSLDYEDGLEDLAHELEFIAGKVESVGEALQALKKPAPEEPPRPSLPV